MRSFLHLGLIQLSTAVLIAVIAVPAWAHILPGDTLNYRAGFFHPLLGWDHIAAMLAVGMLAYERQSFKRVLAVFALGMSVGWGLTQFKLAWAGVEFGVGGSLIALGLAMLAPRQLASVLGFALFAATGFLHGHAHGADYVSMSQPLSYLAGFLSGSSLLLLAGYALQQVLQGWWGGRQSLAASGVVVTLVGSWLLWGRF